MKKDITTRKDIQLLIDTFYEQVKTDPTIGYIFTEVANLDWELHLPVMYSFWASLLIGEATYSGNPMIKHLELNRKVSLTDKEFNAWLSLFTTTVDELFKGPVAEQVKTRAYHIAKLMQHKIMQDLT